MNHTQRDKLRIKKGREAQTFIFKLMCELREYKSFPSHWNGPVSDYHAYVFLKLGGTEDNMFFARWKSFISAAFACKTIELTATTTVAKYTDLQKIHEKPFTLENNY